MSDELEQKMAQIRGRVRKEPTSYALDDFDKLSKTEYEESWQELQKKEKQRKAKVMAMRQKKKKTNGRKNRV